MTINFSREEIKLKKKTQTIISRAKECSKKSRVTIVAKRRKGSICIIDQLKNISLLESFTTVFLKLNPPIPYFYKRSSDSDLSKINTLETLIYSQGGLEKTINKLIAFLRNDRKYLSGHEEVNYGSMVLYSCESAMFATNKSHYRTIRNPMPYCSLCWRRVEYSKYYCQEHHPKQSRNQHYSSRAALFSAIKNTKSEFQIELQNHMDKKQSTQLALLMYKWTQSFAEQPIMIKKQFPNIDVLYIQNWKKAAVKIQQFCLSTYPRTYNKTQYVVPNSFENWESWSLSIIAELDPTEAIFWEIKELSEWLGFDSPYPPWMTLLAVLQRHEATEVINSLPQPRGVKKGSTRINPRLTKNICDEISNLKHNSQRINQAEIARKLDIPRSTVNRIIKKYDLL